MYLLDENPEFFTYDGVVSKDKNIYLVNDSNPTFVGLPAIDVVTIKRNGHGELFYRGWYANKKIPVNILVVIDNVKTNVVDYLDQVHDWLSGIEAKKLILSRTPNRHYYAYVDGDIQWRISQLTTFHVAVASVTFNATSPFGLGNDLRVKEYSVAANQASTQKVTNIGNRDGANTKIIFSNFTGTQFKIDLSNTTNGIFGSLSYTVKAGTVIDVDSETKNVYVDGVINNSGWDGDFITLVGKHVFKNTTGENTIVIANNNATTGFRVRIEYRDLYV